MSITVAPDDFQSESRSAVSVPGIGRDKTDRLRRDRKRIDGELVNRWVGFIDAGIFNRKYRIQ